MEQIIKLAEEIEKHAFHIGNKDIRLKAKHIASRAKMIKKEQKDG